MIGSVFEFDAQMREQARRRQEAAARQSAAPVTSSLPVTAAPFAAGLPATGYAAPPAALKGTAPDITKPGKGKRLPSVPKPEPEHVSWAKRVLGEGYQASVKDRVDASRILGATGLNPGDFHGGREPDDAPPGARDIAEAHLAREQAMTERTSRKSYADRGAELGPAEGKEPGHPEPASFDRGYVESGHAARSPQAAGPRTNPMPMMSHRVLPDQPYASSIPPEAMTSYSMGSPSDK